MLSSIYMSIVATNVLAGLLVIVPLWRVFSRAGLSPLLSLLVFIPLFGFFAVLLVLAVMRWPATGGSR